MNVDERQLALECYGYGRWEAPYWFIGPEQGQGKWENSILTERANAFRELNQDGLCLSLIHILDIFVTPSVAGFHLCPHWA